MSNRMADNQYRSRLKMPSPFQNACKNGEYKDLVKTIKECSKMPENKDQPPYIQQITGYTAALPYYWEKYPETMQKFLTSELMEVNIMKIFEREKLSNWATSLAPLRPLVTTGDGNCLLHAASLYMWAIEDTELVLRTLIYRALNVGNFADANMHRWQAERASLDAQNIDVEFRYNTGEWGKEYDMVKKMVSLERASGVNQLPYQSLEEFHIFVLANILRRPIIVIAHNKMHSNEGHSIQPQSVSGLYFPMSWHPSLCIKSPIVLGFHCNHFFPLIHTGPEKSSAINDYIIPIHGADLKLLRSHFLLPTEDSDYIIEQYLIVDTFIHCRQDMSTALALHGAKLGCKTLGKGVDIWEVYFQLSEHRIRIYNEEEFNPQHADQMELWNNTDNKLSVSSQNKREKSLEVVGASRNEQMGLRQPGQCKTPRCPYQPSLGTGDVCVECFNKGHRDHCRSADCLNQADVGLNGFCKVCHESNKFQMSNSRTLQPTVASPVKSQHKESPSNSPGMDRFQGTVDLDSVAVDTVLTGTDKCVVPECQLTGNPKTNDMCQNCFMEHNEVAKHYSDSLSRRDARTQGGDPADDFVIVDEKGETAQRNPSPTNLNSSDTNKSDLKDRHAKLMRELNMEDCSGATVRSSSPGVRPKVSEKLLQDERKVESAPVTRDQLRFTVEKDLCATAGCHGVRLNGIELCRKCHNQSEAPTDDRIRNTDMARDVQPLHRPTDFGHQERPAAGSHKGQKRPCKMRKCDEPAVPPTYKYCSDCWEDIMEAKETPMPRDEQYSRSRTPTPPLSPQELYEASRKVSQEPSTKIHAQFPPPVYVNSRQDDPANLYGPKRYGGVDTGTPVRNESFPSRGTVTRTQQLDQQLRAEFVRDNSDLAPVATQHYQRPPQRRNGPVKCQNPGGCPDDMFGSPYQDNKCSKCWHKTTEETQQNRKTTPGQDHTPKTKLTSGEQRLHDQQMYQTARVRNINNRTQPRNRHDNRQVVSGEQRLRDAPMYQTASVGRNAMRGQIPAGGRLPIDEPSSLENHVYEPIDSCAQPNCRKERGDNVEGFCEDCHKNYQELFLPFRQINNTA